MYTLLYVYIYIYTYVPMWFLLRRSVSFLTDVDISCQHFSGLVRSPSMHAVNSLAICI